MLTEMVIDTNVLLHAQNPHVAEWKSSKDLLQAILVSSVCLCVDPGFHEDPAKNRSLIGAEYLAHVQHGSLGFAVISQLAGEHRILPKPKLVSAHVSRRINQLLRKKRDRTFLKVACNSCDRVLVSHDYQDFQAAKRNCIKKELSVRVIEASICCGEFAY